MLVARDAEKLKAATAALAPWPVEVHVVSADLADPGDVTRAAQVILDRWPALDILVNNAGTARFLPFVETDEAALDLHLNLNVKAPYLLTRQLFGALAARQGTVINISSYFAHRMLPGRPSTAYSLSKGAIDAFTKALALEAGPQGVRVNAIAPGTVNTPLVQAFRARMDAEAQTQYAAMVKPIYPLGRIGEPDDVAGAAVFLASDHARWMTGAIMAVDGGLTTN
jgi:NAD(P)-dependent dehydrogenase (short-subunit alcohol dehydrogenase family)